MQKALSFIDDCLDTLFKIAETALHQAGVVNKRNNEVSVIPPSHHPFGRHLLSSIMGHLGRKSISMNEVPST